VRGAPMMAVAPFIGVVENFNVGDEVEIQWPMVS
jgi:hypothetical protein